MTTADLRQLLERLVAGEVDADAVLAHLSSGASVTTDDAQVDVGRRNRCGFPEVVYCEGKPAESIVRIFEVQQQHGETAFGTRLSPEQASVVLERFPDAIYNATARTIRLPFGEQQPLRGRVAVVTAGTSDRPVAEEAVETLHWTGCETELIVDVGVAGPHRLPEHLHRLHNSDAVIVVAGMEGALPSVVGGWVDCPVIAVPTSVGYGAAFGGLAALLGMLNSCASNVTVVNIDAGFKAGYVAGLIAKRATAARD